MNELRIWNPFCIVPIDGPNIKNCAIATYGDKIIDIDVFDKLLKRYPGSSIVQLKDSIIMPGFIDCHTHFELTNLHAKENYNDLFQLMIKCGEWHKTVSCDEISDSCKNGQAISLKNGVVYTLDWRSQIVKNNDYIFPDNVTVAFEVIGARSEFANEIFQKKIDLVKQSAKSVQQYYWAPHSLYMVSEKLWSLLSESEHPITTHIAESSHEIEWLSTGKGTLYEHCVNRSAIATLKKITQNPLEIIQERGNLKGGTIFVHGTWLSNNDLSCISKNNCFLCLCPSSNLQLTGRLIDFSKILENDVRFLIGSDSIAARYDLLYEARLLLTNFDTSPDKGIARKLLRALTIEAAKALNIIDYYGSVDVGKKANFVVITLNKPIKISSIEIDIILHGKIKSVILNGQAVVV